jgi:hypothetical protein
MAFLGPGRKLGFPRRGGLFRELEVKLDHVDRTRFLSPPLSDAYEGDAVSKATTIHVPPESNHGSKHR